MNNVKTFFKLILFVTVIALMAGSCASINELAKYNLSEKKFLFKTITTNSPAQVQINVTTSRKRNKNGVFENVFYDAGAMFVVSEVESKLRRVYNSDSVSTNLTESIESILTTYREINVVQDISENPDFIVETRLDRFILSASENGVYSSFAAVTTIYDRKTAKKVWERSEGISQPLIEEYYYSPRYYNPRAYNPRTKNPNPRYGTSGYKNNYSQNYGRTISLFMLMSMSEEEIRSAINYTTAIVAEQLSNDLREDLAETIK